MFVWTENPQTLTSMVPYATSAVNNLKQHLNGIHLPGKITKTSQRIKNRMTVWSFIQVKGVVFLQIHALSDRNGDCKLLWQINKRMSERYCGLLRTTFTDNVLASKIRSIFYLWFCVSYVVLKIVLLNYNVSVRPCPCICWCFYFKFKETGWAR